MYPIDGNFIKKVAPRYSGARAAAQAAIIGEVGPVLAATLDRYDINTKLRIAHFMGQVTHECAGFRTTEEFASGSAYEGRKDLGNTQPGDGRRYKGRGLLQLTGRANYRQYGKQIGIDLESEPDRAADPAVSLLIACEYWKSRNLNAASDRDDLVAVTRGVNGGTNGLTDRGEYVKRAKIALADMEAIALGMKTGEPVLRRGSSGDAVGALQAALQRAGMTLAIDNDFGPATELAVRLFQAKAGLPETGMVDQAVLDRLAV